jgi:hypothetical protein
LAASISANADSAAFGPVIYKIKIIERGVKTGVKFKRQIFIFKLNDEASDSCSELELQSRLVKVNGV